MKGSIITVVAVVVTGAMVVLFYRGLKSLNKNRKTRRELREDFWRSHGVTDLRRKKR